LRTLSVLYIKHSIINHSYQIFASFCIKSYHISILQYLSSEILSEGYGQAVHISEYYDLDIYQCLRSNGILVVFIRVYEAKERGMPDLNAIANIKNANTANLGVEIFVEPQVKSTKYANEQFLEVYRFLINNDIIVNTIWLKVESFFLSNVNVGIYTSWYDWYQITGGWSSWANQYWHLLSLGPDSATNYGFSDFRSFSGFFVPHVKHFVECYRICGLSFSSSIFLIGNAAKVKRKTSMEDFSPSNASAVELGISVGFLDFTSPSPNF
ncbi:unnamed protein product, partial [Thelazia callipaeda]|uniref:GH26 domain-containing protein n=1 Tax=Thelazia callipaeda TaxID=103827 RepID=A0A0N5D3A1_THECL